MSIDTNPGAQFSAMLDIATHQRDAHAIWPASVKKQGSSTAWLGPN